MFIIEFVDSVFFCQKSCQILSYKSDTCTRFSIDNIKNSNIPNQSVGLLIWNA